jgi:hypothetical protein
VSLANFTAYSDGRGGRSIIDPRSNQEPPRVVRGSVAETSNALDAGYATPGGYERSANRRNIRAGHYDRNLQTKAG